MVRPLPALRLMPDLLLGLRASLGERPLHIICLGLGRPAIDRTAQIQLALILELASALKVRSITALCRFFLTSGCEGRRL